MLFALLALAAHAAPPSTAPPALIARLRAKDQALLDAIAPGDRALWDRTLTANAVYVDENGRVLSRADFLKEMTGLPPGSSGNIKIIDYDVRLDGDTALVRHLDDEHETYHGQPLHAQYLTTETWLKRGGDWKRAGTHAYAVNVDPPAIAPPTATLDAYVGTYVMADLTYTVRRDGDHLTGQQSGGPARPLLAETSEVFFTPGRPRTRTIFQRDAAGRAARLISRREGEDLVFVRKAD